ncbi:MAG: aspartate--tRNA(Asn) ligase [Candidatus Nealsonbacteria bacterium RIFOXYB1_FULL_40_15]|uniref:Aspartate--tRNA ligase n=2 Tax=Candidatus Nealsoniibacteriota TaxID=1817911 RepID=A0A1G2EQP3_9BACT|nr:MAG: aspartate--tRNA(Asn) ligase [Candidatus Nealsonbacteria bacterium RIFOXYB1_FULL_40_15]OGZ28067.1 MAG: aspartate--tRNA(Asn) ligase [Candidatus Nealsonbacteria bacterium RIFOXYC1_FULL_40_7]OGZ28528.1 MAG: aspartate--tRNA(Asn) ligase [Candidatus Nealsonbacteria bacterium RIFOXYD1_FULL_39_11]
MERILINQIEKKEGQKIMIKGRILNMRNLGNVVFLIAQDYTGTIQVVFDKSIEVKIGDSVAIEGVAKKEPRSKYGYEIQGESIEIISAIVEDLPFDLAKNDLNLNLPTLLDYRTLSLRHPKVQAIFKLYDIFLKGYETVMREEGFTEVKTPKILGAATEGGANFFKVKYFDKEATLAQSPQFYKQIMVGVFERVFEIGSAFRAEPHFTTRHVNEYISLDAEMGYIKDFYDVTDILNKVLKRIFLMIEKEGKQYLDMYNIKISEVPDSIPRVKLSEIRKIAKERYNYSIPDDTDIDPEGERLAGRYAKEEFNSDFVFITHYPWSEKPFYTMQSKENPEETYGFDLIYKGLEIVTGSQRIHIYKELMENMKKKKIKPDGMEFYLDTFKYAMPPHGGWGWGSERTIQQILELGSIKEAILFPRDVKRLMP